VEFDQDLTKAGDAAQGPNDERCHEHHEQAPSAIDECVWDVVGPNAN